MLNYYTPIDTSCLGRHVRPPESPPPFVHSVGCYLHSLVLKPDHAKNSLILSSWVSLARRTVSNYVSLPYFFFTGLLAAFVTGARGRCTLVGAESVPWFIINYTFICIIPYTSVVDKCGSWSTLKGGRIMMCYTTYPILPWIVKFLSLKIFRQRCFLTKIKHTKYFV